MDHILLGQQRGKGSGPDVGARKIFILTLPFLNSYPDFAWTLTFSRINCFLYKVELIIVPSLHPVHLQGLKKAVDGKGSGQSWAYSNSSVTLSCLSSIIDAIMNKNPRHAGCLSLAWQYHGTFLLVLPWRLLNACKAFRTVPGTW